MFKSVEQENRAMIRLLNKVVPNPKTGCWEFVGCQIPGKLNYGQFGISTGRMKLAHRVSFTIFKGEIPPGMCVLHSCDNPPCVNPEHLRIGTQRENVVDTITRKRHFQKNQTHCKRGHEFTEQNIYWIPSGAGRACRTCRTLQ